VDAIQFAESEERAHVEEVNESSAFRWQATGEISTLPVGGPLVILIHDVQQRADGAGSIDAWNIM
jgi:hypothetical protein